MGRWEVVTDDVPKRAVPGVILQAAMRHSLLDILTFR
jgi:hypothetical protein